MMSITRYYFVEERSSQTILPGLAFLVMVV